jgi:hypothetical protein
MSEKEEAGPWDDFKKEESGPWQEHQKATEAGPPPESTGRWASGPGRFVQGMAEPVMGTAQLAANLTGIGKDYMNKKAQEAADFYKRSRQEAGYKEGDLDYWAGAGNLASPINFVPGAAVGRIGKAATTLGRVGEGMLAGGAGAAMQPVVDLKPGQTYGEAKEDQVVPGVLGGAVLGPLGHTVAGALSPQLDADAVKIIKEGGQVSPGRILGGVYRKAEDVAAHTPGVSQIIGDVHGENLAAMDRVRANRALKPLGMTLPEDVAPGYDTTKFVRNELTAAYKSVHAGMTAVPDPQFQAEMARIMSTAQRRIPTRATALEDILNEQINEKEKSMGGVLDGSAIQGIRSELRTQARTWAKDPSADTTLMGQYLDEANNAFGQLLERQNPTLAPALKKVDQAYANYAIIRDASKGSTSMGREGVATPSRYAQAVERAARGKTGTSGGTAMQQDLAAAGKRLFPEMANSQTAQRSAMHGMMFGAGLTGGALGFGPASLVSIPLLAAMYSKPAKQMLNWYAKNQPQNVDAVRQLLQQYAPATSARTAVALANQPTGRPKRDRNSK